MKDLLKVARENHFGIPAFNISDYAMFKGIMDLCERLEAPVIIEIHPNELKLLGDDALAAIRSRCLRSSVPVCIHLDHGASYEQAVHAIQCGFTSVMIDGSSLPFEENIAISRKIVELAHPVNVSVESELGTIGETTSAEAYENQVILYTNPDDAETFIRETGADTLAVAIGTSHGLYPKGIAPHLKLDLLKELNDRLGIPLVLHGGSGNRDEEIAASVKLGVCKLNISSDIKKAYFDKMREVLKDESLREPGAIEPACVKAMQEVAEHKLALTDAIGKASLYHQ